MRLRVELCEEEEVEVVVKLMHARSTTPMAVTAEETADVLSLRHFNLAATQV